MRYPESENVQESYVLPACEPVPLEPHITSAVITLIRPVGIELKAGWIYLADGHIIQVEFDGYDPDKHEGPFLQIEIADDSHCPLGGLRIDLDTLSGTVFSVLQQKPFYDFLLDMEWMLANGAQQEMTVVFDRKATSQEILDMGKKCSEILQGREKEERVCFDAGFPYASFYQPTLTTLSMKRIHPEDELFDLNLIHSISSGLANHSGRQIVRNFYLNGDQSNPSLRPFITSFNPWDQASIPHVEYMQLWMALHGI